MRAFVIGAVVTAICAGPIAAENHEPTTISHGISAFGELKYPADFTHFDYASPDAPKGGTMSFRGTLASGTYDSLNPFILKGESAQGIERTFDTLMVRAFDEPDAVYGLLAETIEYPEDRSWVIFTLREEAAFSDGSPLTAEDVAYTFNTIKEKGAPTYQNQLQDIESVSVLSEREVRVDFAEDAAKRDLIAKIGAVEIFSKEYFSDVEFDRSSLDPLLGSGPYLVNDVDPGRSITYCRNPNYWAVDLPVNVGKDNFECYIYEYFADSTAAFEALKAGVYLFHEEFFSAIWATGYDFPALEKEWVRREVLKDGRPAGAQGLYFNTRLEKFQDRRVREAVGLLFNFEWSNETLFYGLYSRTDSFFEGTDMQASGVLEGAELAVLEPFRDQLPERVFTEPAFVPNVSTTRKTDRGAVRRANSLLEEAGWIIGDDGLRRNSDGEVLSIELIDDGPAFERIVLPFIENLKIVGIDAKWELIDSAQIQERQENFDYDLYIARFVLPLFPSIELRSLFSSEQANNPGSFNLSGVADPVVDALIDEINKSEDRDTLVTRARALDRVLRDKVLWVPNWNKGEHWIAYWDVFGRPEIKPPYDRGIDYWWWDEAKANALKEAGALR